MTDTMKAKHRPLPTLPPDPVAPHHPVAVSDAKRERATVIALFSALRVYVDEATTDEWAERIAQALPRWLGPLRGIVRRIIDRMLPEPMLTKLEVAILNQLEKRQGVP